MARIKGAVTTRRRRNRVLKLAKGYWGARSKHFRVANQAVMKSLQYAYISRRLKKRDFRRLWITRISAGVKQYGLNYSRFMYALKKMDLNLNRKVLSEMAVYDKAAFAVIVEKAKDTLTGYGGSPSD